MNESIQPWWEQLTSAQQPEDGSPPSTFAQLATVHPSCNGPLSGRPAVRTVNIRTLQNNNPIFISDLRSQKASDLSHNTHAELCWYFPVSQKQFRLSGIVKIHSNDTLAKTFWTSLSYLEQRWWAWPTPGDPRASSPDFLKAHEPCIPKHFCVCVLQVDYVDILDLKVMPFEREIHQLQSNDSAQSWASRRVNP